MDQSATNYDPAGNLKVDPQTSLTYTYDDENRVIMAVSSGATIAQYWYDAEGQRIRKISSAGTEEYVYDTQGQQIGEMQPNGSLNRFELYAGSRHLATYDNVHGQTIFVHNDWQGTERVRSKLDGTSYETCINTPYGDNQTCSGGPDSSPLHYTGKMRDTETTLDYFGARYYSSGMGHWMSPDWAAKPASVPYANFGDPQSLNLYAFVSGNPVSRQDSDGHLLTLAQMNGEGEHGMGQGSEVDGEAPSGPDGTGQSQKQPLASDTTPKPSSASTATTPSPPTTKSKDKAATPASTMPMPLPLSLPSLEGAARVLLDGFLDMLGTVVGPAAVVFIPTSMASEAKDTIHETSKSNPLEGKPGETVTLKNPDGTPKQVRRYGPDGYPKPTWITGMITLE